MKARGEKHFRAKLTDDQVRDMRNLRQLYGKSYSVLGQIFGCSMWTAREIVTYNTRTDA